MMTLRNMRENGVRSLAITCGAVWCHHQAVLDVNGFADDVAVPAFGPRMVCTVCGAIGADALMVKRGPCERLIVDALREELKGTLGDEGPRADQKHKCCREKKR